MVSRHFLFPLSPPKEPPAQGSPTWPQLLVLTGEGPVIIEPLKVHSSGLRAKPALVAPYSMGSSPAMRLAGSLVALGPLSLPGQGRCSHLQGHGGHQQKAGAAHQLGYCLSPLTVPASLTPQLMGGQLPSHPSGYHWMPHFVLGLLPGTLGVGDVRDSAAGVMATGLTISDYRVDGALGLGALVRQQARGGKQLTFAAPSSCGSKLGQTT